MTRRVAQPIQSAIVRMTPTTAVQTRSLTVALMGNPNSGKTTLFNALTGLRQKVANYPGVTVEKKTGIWEADDAEFRVIDLPGCYSLTARSPDEKIAIDHLYGRGVELPPDAVICVVDVTNLSRHLYLVGQVAEVGLPVVVALTMVDEAERTGVSIDCAKLSERLGLPVTEIVAPKRVGLQDLAAAVSAAVADRRGKPIQAYRLPPALETCLKEYAPVVPATELQTLQCVAGQHSPTCTAGLEEVAQQVRTKLGVTEETVTRFIIEGRYTWQRDVARDVVCKDPRPTVDWTRRLDNALLHPIAGPLILLLILTLVFQSVFTWAKPPMEAIGYVTGTWLPSLTSRILAPGPLLSLINNGIFAGVGSVVTFLPQILLLYCFLTLLEDAGYLARAAFLLDRPMSKVGLSGRSFIPLLSSFACAIPGIMATRTVPNARDRLATILVAPLMTCSARLVVYTMLIAAFVPPLHIWGPFGLQGLTLLGLYLLGIAGAAGTAALFRRTILRGPTPPFLLELPIYRKPRLKTLGLTLLERTRLFLASAGTTIFAVSVILWGLSSYPRLGEAEQQAVTERAAIMQGPDDSVRSAALASLDEHLASKRLRHSAAGYLGKAIEPILRPLGFDWKIGIGIVGSFAAREVFVSTMAVVYGVGSASDDRGLIAQLKADRDPETHLVVWTPLVALTLLVFYAFALQCISTIAVMRRETNSWKWPVFAWSYMAVMGYGAALLTTIIGRHF